MTQFRHTDVILMMHRRRRAPTTFSHVTMTGQMTLFLTKPTPLLLAQLTRLRPDLKVMGLVGDALPVEVLSGPVWGFIDWLLPELSGLELCRRIRETGSARNAHITMVLESGDAETQRRALKAGADNYLVGPLTAGAVLELVGGSHHFPDYRAKGSKLRHGEITIDLSAYQARYHGIIVPLRPNEFRLLAYFIEHPDQVFSRLALIDCLGKHAAGIDERTVDVWVGRLRRALLSNGAPDPLRTVRSLGYVMDSPSVWQD